MLSHKWPTEASSGTVEGALKNQLARLSIQQMSTDSFPSHPNTQSCHGGKNRGHTGTQQHALPSTKPDLVTISAECPPPHSRGSKSASNKGPSQEGSVSQSLSSKMTTLDSWYCRGETVIYPYKNTYSRFSFPINTIYLQKAIRVNILSHTHFHVYRKVWQNLHINFTCKVNFFLSSRSGQHDQLLKAQLQHQPRALTGGHPKPVAAGVTLGHLCTAKQTWGPRGKSRSDYAHCCFKKPLKGFCFLSWRLQVRGVQKPSGQRGTHPPGHRATALLKWKLRLNHFGLLMPLNEQAQKGDTVLAERLAATSILLHNRSKNSICNSGGSMEGLWGPLDK